MKIFKYSQTITTILVIVNIIVGIGLSALYVYAMVYSTDIPSHLYFYDIIFALGVACPLLIIAGLVFKINNYLSNRNKSTH